MAEGAAGSLEKEGTRWKNFSSRYIKNDAKIRQAVNDNFHDSITFYLSLLYKSPRETSEFPFPDKRRRRTLTRHGKSATTVDRFAMRYNNSQGSISSVLTKKL
ncbi:MAG: hypothetical protein LIQ31_00225 [Planctomycetes bacterium]|nr:hypothetical protein [Planctomycetota bacterium]